MSYGFGTEAFNKRAEQAGSGDGTKSEWWKPAVGDKVGESKNSPIRIVSLMEEMGQHNNGSSKPQTCIGKSAGCPRCKDNEAYGLQHQGDKEAMKKNPHKVSVKFLCWVLDLNDFDPVTKNPKFKLAQLGWGIVGAVNDLYKNEDWQDRFVDGIVAMKLTVVGTKTGELKQNVEYSVQPSPAADPLTPELRVEASKLDDVKKIAFNLKKKQAKEWNIDLVEVDTSVEPEPEPPKKDEIDVSDIPF